MISRVANLADIPHLVELVNSVYRGENALKGWTTEAELLDGQRIDSQMLSEVISSTDKRIFVLEEAKKIIGCVQSTDSGDSVLLGMLSVPVELQGKGLGARLIKVVEDDAKERGCTHVKMHVLSIRQELLDWYYRKGYQDTGEREDWPWGDLKWGVPKRDDLEFLVITKRLML